MMHNPSQPNKTISVFHANALLERAYRAGVNVAPLLDRIGIPQELLGNGNNRICSRQYLQLAIALIYEVGDEFLLCGGKPRTAPGTFALMCQAVIHSKNLKQAIMRCCKFYSLFHIDVRFRLRLCRNEAVITVAFSDPQSDWDHTTTDCCLLILHRFFSWLVGRQLELTQVSLSGAANRGEDDYRRLFGTDVAFNCAFNGLHFDRRQLEIPIVQNQHTLDDYLENIVDHLHEFPDNNSYSGQIRRLINEAHEQSIPDFSTVARLFDSNTQTLRRQLRAEGTSYQTLKNNIRREAAIHYLKHSQHSIDEIANLVGYSEISSFHRAFKKWTGRTPSEYRHVGQMSLAKAIS